MLIEVFEPGLVVLIGAAGSGKTAFAARHFEAAEILSSDAYRALISGDEADQRATRAAFGRLHRDLAQRLHAGRLAVVDATNLERAARRTLLQKARAAGLPAVAVVLDLPTTTVHERNAGRAGRVVDAAVVDRHLRLVRDTMAVPPPGLLGEGFAAAYVIRDPRELDLVGVVRRPANAATRR